MWVRTSRSRAFKANSILISVLLLMTACGGGGGDNGGGGGGGPTGPVPTVLSAAPGDGATNVGTNTNVFATFSTDMDASTITSTNFTLDQGVNATVTYDSTHKIAKLHPTGSLAAGTTYTATVSTGAKSSGGRNLAATYTWSFTTAAAGTDTTAPTVVSTTPANNATGVALNTVIKIQFSEAMDPTSFPDKLVIQLDATHNVTLTLTWNAKGDMLSLVPPSTGLPPGIYDIEIKGYTDTSGNPIATTTLHFETVTS